MVRKQQLIKVFSQKLSIRNVVAQVHQNFETKVIFETIVNSSIPEKI